MNGDHGDVACDHYRRYRDDVALMRELGLNAYRFSISWSRVFPEGTGAVNAAGLDFYDSLVDALLEAGITPNATLFHWDLPAALDDRGGWLNGDIADWFGHYAAAVFKRLDDRVTMWATLNEPWVVTDAGYMHGTLAPGHRNIYEAPIAAHNLLRAHGRAMQAYRAIGRNRIGLVVNLEPKSPASQSPQDLAAVRRADAYMNRQYLDPVFFGEYPKELIEMYDEAWPKISHLDMQVIKQPLDFLGINYYKRAVTRHDDAKVIERAVEIPNPRATYTDIPWEVYPQGLTDVLTWVAERYGKLPIYITENGAAFYDPPVAEGGVVSDPLRVDYLRKHISAVGAAMDAGVDVRGYYVWSLLDNFEWAYGFSKRFGIIHVDYKTLQRTPKDSARFYAEVIRTKGRSL
jgi:beta-glucosidase